MLSNALGFSLYNQFGFQTAATPFMEGIIDLHHNLFFFMIMIFIFVFWIIMNCVFYFVTSEKLILLYEKHFYKNSLSGIVSNNSYYSLESPLVSTLIINFFNIKNEFLKNIISKLFSFDSDIASWAKIKNRSQSLRFNHGTVIEFVWTIAPCFILAIIAIQSFNLLYSAEDVTNAYICIKVIGHQWYWTYEYTYVYDKVLHGAVSADVVVPKQDADYSVLLDMVYLDIHVNDMLLDACLDDAMDKTIEAFKKRRPILSDFGEKNFIALQEVPSVAFPFSVHKSLFFPFDDFTLSLLGNDPRCMNLFGDGFVNYYKAKYSIPFYDISDTKFLAAYVDGKKRFSDLDYFIIEYNVFDFTLEQVINNVKRFCLKLEKDMILINNCLFDFSGDFNHMAESLFYIDHLSADLLIENDPVLKSFLDIYYSDNDSIDFLFDLLVDLENMDVDYIIKHVNITSYMVPTDELNVGDLRLLECDKVLYVPAHVHINFYITAVDVLHSWAIPSLGIKMDAIPGRLNMISTYIARTGVYYGQCSEICGINHGFMPIVLIAYEK